MIVYNGAQVIPGLIILSIFIAFIGILRWVFHGSVPTMVNWKTLPKTFDDWLALLLVPAKTYVAVGYTFLAICLREVTFFKPLGDDSPLTAHIVTKGYFFAVVALICGAVIQSIFCRQRFRRVGMTLCFVLLGVLYWHMMGEVVFMGR